MKAELSAQGWYRDPYGIHEDRYMSQGVPTKLVRDGGHESYDVPPNQPLPEGDLVPAEEVTGQEIDGSDLHRADDANRDADAWQNGPLAAMEAIARWQPLQ